MKPGFGVISYPESSDGAAPRDSGCPVPDRYSGAFMEFETIERTYDFVVAGGGFTGICCAVMAARQGLKTALVTNRGFIGGNSGAEVRCPVDGADGEQLFNFNSRETGLIEEIRLKNLYVNRDGNPYRWDMVLTDLIAAEEKLDLYLNTCIDRVDTEDGRDGAPGRITRISGIRFTEEKRFVFNAPLFADNTGDGTVAYLAGCTCRTGAESRETYGEKIAGEEASGDVLLGTLTYNAKDLGRKVEFTPPAAAFDMEKSGCLDHREIPEAMFERFVWFYETEYGLDQVKDSEEIAALHRSLLYSIWDHIKKHPEKYGAENYDFEYISPYVGKRESRRVLGLKALTERDVVEQTGQEDACGYGGWAIDLHSPKGFFGADPENRWVYLKGIYPIPLGCAIAKETENLFVIGRCFSVSHVALGSARLNATLATVGQAVGIAAALCREKNITPHAIGAEEIGELHRRQWREDQTVIGYRNRDPEDLALTAEVTASSEKPFRMDTPVRFFGTETVTGQSMPVKPELKKIRFAYRAKTESLLCVDVFRAEKPQNYGPEKLLKHFALTLPASEKTAWFTLDLSDLSLEEEFLFFRFDGTSARGLELAAGEERLPGVAAVMQKPNSLPNIMDYETLAPLPCEWMKLGLPLQLRKYSTAPQPNLNTAYCFVTEPELRFYGPENVNNGYLRPYRQPNIWVARGAAGEFLELRLREAAKLRELDLTMDTNLNFRIRNVKAYPFNTIAECVKDFDVLYREPGSAAWKLFRRVEGNCQRFCRIGMGQVRAEAVKIVIRGTNGCPSAGIYNISLYGCERS